MIDSSDKENAVLGLAPFTGADNQLFSIEEIGDVTGLENLEVTKRLLIRILLPIISTYQHQWKR